MIVTEASEDRVIDGVSPKGIEDNEGIQQRKDFLRTIGYKA